MVGEKVTLLAERLLIIRVTYSFADGSTETRYFETEAMWNKSPLHATIFQTWDAADAYFEGLGKDSNWFDGRKASYEIVGLYHELSQSPNGTLFTLTPK